MNSILKTTCAFLTTISRGSTFKLKMNKMSVTNSKFYSNGNENNDHFKVDGLEVETKFGAKTIWLDNPKKKNAMTKEMYENITKILNESAKDDKIILCVLRGKGDYFCSGTDLTKMDTGDNTSLKNYVASFIDFPKPMIAVVNGPAIGIGTTILGLCDVVFAKDTATFLTPFSTLGLCPEACSSYTFPQLMGKRKAFELLMLGKKITAIDAKENYNLVTEVFKPEEFDEEVEKRLEELSKLPKLSLLFSKELIQMPDKDILHQVNKRETIKVSICKNSEDNKVALENFYKRKK